MPAATKTPEQNKAQTIAMMNRFREVFPAGSAVTVNGKTYTVQSIRERGATLLGGRGKEYHVTPCLNATVIARRDLTVFAIVWSSARTGRSVAFGIDTEGKIIDLA